MRHEEPIAEPCQELIARNITLPRAIAEKGSAPDRSTGSADLLNGQLTLPHARSLDAKRDDGDRPSAAGAHVRRRVHATGCAADDPILPRSRRRRSVHTPQAARRAADTDAPPFVVSAPEATHRPAAGSTETSLLGTGRHPP